MTGTVAASLPLTLRQPGMETRCPEGAGQRQRSWLGAKHDSPGSRQEVARSENGNGRIRMDYMRLNGKPRQQGGEQSRDG
ncbi:hypothetical protein V3E26_004217 [Salmonella enterica]|uniref:hypothetical protein n=1 Tax=Salmonella enterica TaxID=28901 RepID=UPI0009AE05ED|nr:hypothetical protein [Salmonella enterica]